ncbi:hypothetical protein FGB62_26g20 [Gracilaria domingensis]|nr:hypothetical protein FGB62_26g20 [Gracilaria domingensis]
MEFLQTPDLARGHWASASPTRAFRSALTPAEPGTSPTPLHAVPHTAPSGLTPAALEPVPNATPKALMSVTPFISQLDRAGIKSSFQSLFSPHPDTISATPALLPRKPPSSGLTPFLNATTTPGLVPPSPSLLPTFTPGPAQNGILPSPNGSDPMQRTPYLAAAAREAVRREFMNMPSYVAPGPAPHQSPGADAERKVPDNTPSPKYSMQVVANTGVQVDTPAQRKGATEPSHTESTHPGAANSSMSSPSDAKVPERDGANSTNAKHRALEQSSSEQKARAHKNDQQPQHPPTHPFFIPHHAQPPPGMMMLGQHAPMMMPHPPGMFPPPGMMVFPGAQPMMPQPGMLMHPPQAMVPQRVVPAKQETPTERKVRVENEKQELIREFKKKTREAALVRFRQKRRERRFGKLIRYDCRKKLADARPRVKGRFVRLKANDEDAESESAQVVPNLKSR